MVDRDLDGSYLENESGNIDQTYRAQTDQLKNASKTNMKMRLGHGPSRLS